MGIRRIAVFTLVAILSSLATATTIATAGAIDNFASDATSAFGPVVKQFNIPGLVVGVTRNGEHEFYATGMASIADARPVTADTLFELGYISKVFSATLAALAEGRGKLSLNDTAADHLCSDSCSMQDNLTLMDLATHHSGGLPLQVPDNIADVKALVGWLKDWKPPQPGTRSYSNISIGLLGYIAGNAIAKNYGEALQTVLFPAFGLQHTWIDVPTNDIKQYAFGYDRKTNEPIRIAPGLLDAEAYGVKSTARDMLRVLDVELGRESASDELRKAIARTREGQFKTAFFVQDMIWEQYPWPADLKEMLSGNGYDFILKPQPVDRLTPPLAPQNDVILNKTGSTNGFGA